VNVKRKDNNINEGKEPDYDYQERNVEIRVAVRVLGVEVNRENHTYY
jgi:hypothetical protein